MLTRPALSRFAVVVALAVVVGLGGWLVSSWLSQSPSKDDLPTGGDPVEHPSNSPSPAQAIDTRAFELTLVSHLESLVGSENPGYMGPESCRECHAKKYDDASHTNHFRACRPVTEGDMPDGFDNESSLLVSQRGPKFEMKRRGSEYLMRATPPGASESQTNATEARLDLVLGSGGKFDDVFLSWREDGTMVELPMVWLYPSDQWATSHFDPHAGGDYSRPLTVRCLECHNTWINHVVGTANRYRREGAILGVTCESCHGPGKAHVEFHHAHPDVKDSQYVLHPGHFDRDATIDVCGQCHGNQMKRRQPAFSHRPDQPLEQAFGELTTFHHEDDHVANQTKFMRQSVCFKKDATMTCITCHDPHQPTETRMTAQRACLQCHDSIDCSDREQLPEAVRDDCIKCHMPPYIKINVNFQTADDSFVTPIRRWQHEIGIYPEARKEVVRDWHASQADEANQQLATRLTEELVGHYLSVADQALAEYRLVGAIAACREALRIDDRPATRARLTQIVGLQVELEKLRATANQLIAQRRLQEALPVFETILKRYPRDAVAHGRLGTVLAELGDIPAAKQHWEEVVKLDPNDAYGLAMLGWVAYNAFDYEAAKTYYERADVIEPYEAKIHFQLAMIAARQGNLQTAFDYFRQCLEIEPLHPQALQMMVTLLRESKRPSDAIQYATTLVALTGGRNPDALMILAETSWEASNPGQAIAMANRARNVATEVSPALVARIDQRLTVYQQSSSPVTLGP